MILIKGKTQQQDIMILNIDALNTGALKFIKKKRLFNLKSQIDSNTTVDDFNTLLPPINHVEKNLENLRSDIINPMDIMFISRRSQQNPKDDTIFLSGPWNFLQKQAHIRAQNKIQQMKEN